MTAHLRPARPTDAGATGDILWRFQSDTTWMPKLYSAAQTIAFCGALIDRGWVTVAVVENRVAGFMARNGAEICCLYLAPDMKGKGIGVHLVRDAQHRSDRLQLRAFVANRGAQRFYRRLGFVETGRGDGADNDENLPDIAYLWTAQPPKPAKRDAQMTATEVQG